MDTEAHRRNEGADMNDRLEIASRVLAGFAANPSIFVPNAHRGWLCNVTDEDLVGYALSLADKLIDGEKITADRKAGSEVGP